MYAQGRAGARVAERDRRLLPVVRRRSTVVDCSTVRRDLAREVSAARDRQLRKHHRLGGRAVRGIHEEHGTVVAINPVLLVPAIEVYTDAAHCVGRQRRPINALWTANRFASDDKRGDR